MNPKMQKCKKKKKKSKSKSKSILAQKSYGSCFNDIPYHTITCLRFNSIWCFNYYDNQKGLIVMHHVIIKNLRLPVYDSIPYGVLIIMIIRKV